MTELRFAILGLVCHSSAVTGGDRQVPGVQTVRRHIKITTPIPTHGYCTVAVVNQNGLIDSRLPLDSLMLRDGRNCGQARRIADQLGIDTLIAE